MKNWNGVSVLIIGAARQGQALARYLDAKGAKVTLNDKRSSEQLAGPIQAFSKTNVEWVLGDHSECLLDKTDLVCVSGGVPLSLPIIVEAQNRGLPLTNDSEIFMQAVKAPVIGITGSAGKTTTTTLLGRMSAAEIKTPRKVWVGGNIGKPLIEFVDEIISDDLVILELSSFQLEQMTVSPHIAAVLNITPNHLDRHTTMANYVQAKSRILLYQRAIDIAVLNHEDPESWNLKASVKGSLISFGLQEPETGWNAVFVQDQHIVARQGQKYIPLLQTSLIGLRGQHNLVNVIAACAIAWAAEFSTQSMSAGVSGFKGVPHRLEMIRERESVRWYNDSIATAPERTMAAIKSFSEPIVLLLGGRDKELPWDDLSAMIHQRVDHVILYGEAAPMIANALGTSLNGDRLQSISIKTTFKEALEESALVATAGDIVLLSPACTSYDSFRDFEERGECFKKWVSELP